MDFVDRIKAAAKEHDVDVNLVKEIYLLSEKIDSDSASSKNERRIYQAKN